MIIEVEGEKTTSKLYAPERDFNKIEEGVDIIKSII